MSTDFDSFLNGQKANNVDALQKEVQKQQGGNAREVDARFYDFSKIIDKDGNARAVLRLLPAPDTSTPWAKLIKHSWKRQVNGETRYYIENSRKTLGLADPVYDYNGRMFQEHGKDKAKPYLVPRTFRYIANFTFIENDADPESVGKVFLWDFGGQIWEKCEAKMSPAHPKDEKIDPFNIFEGANLILRIYKKDVGDNKLPQYDNSEFQSKSALSTDKAALKALFDQLYPIKPFLEESNFKSYDELKLNLDIVLGLADREKRGGGDAKPAAEKAAEPVKDSIPFDTDTRSSTERNEVSAPVAEQPKSDAADDDWFSKFKS